MDSRVKTARSVSFFLSKIFLGEELNCWNLCTVKQTPWFWKGNKCSFSFKKWWESEKISKTYSNDLPEKTQDEMLFSLDQVVGINVDNVTTDGLGRVLNQLWNTISLLLCGKIYSSLIPQKVDECLWNETVCLENSWDFCVKCLDGCQR